MYVNPIILQPGQIKENPTLVLATLSFKTIKNNKEVVLL